jgi:hypothetical protein
MARVSAKTLLIEIARCPNVGLAYGSHPCRSVVAAQYRRGRTGHHLPEPWTGHIEKAPVLFVGSNPSFSPDDETYPVEQWSDDKIAAYFTTPDRLDLNVRYWNVVRSIARSILDREPRPGYDYALTELVRCKSWNEEGVRQALETCSDLYLERTLQVAKAKVVVALGKVAREGIASYARLRSSEIGLQPGTFAIAGRKRRVLLLGHPSSGQRQTPTDAEAKRLRAFLQGGGDSG